MFGVLLFLGCALNAATGEAVPEMAGFDTFVNGLLDQWHIPGAALGVSHNGRLILARGYGVVESPRRRKIGAPIQPDSLFRIDGISKTVTAAAVLRLVQDGKLSLNEDDDYCRLGRMIESGSGQSYEQYVQSAVLKPLGINRMRLGETQQSCSAAEGWVASVSDLLRLINALDGRRPPRMLLPASIPTMTGSGWVVYPQGRDADWWNHSASDGSSAFVFRQASSGVDAVMLFNGRPRNGANFDSDVEAGLEQAIGSISSWPAVDRFVTGPELFARDIVNAADHQGGGVAPGEIVILYPSNAGPERIVEWPTGTNGGTRVLFNGMAAPIVYTMAGQISAIVPHDVANKAQAEVVVEYRGERSLPVTVPVVASAPAFFTRNASGRGQAAMLNVTGCCNSPRNPVRRGSMAYLFATGEGLTLTRQDQKFREEKPSAVPVPVSPELKVTIGGVPAEVLYAGDAGVLQVNIRVPENAPIGDAIPLVLSAGESLSGQEVTIAVRSSVERILLIEHDEAVRARVFGILRGSGYDVVTASNEEESRVAEAPIDLVITDIATPGEFIRRVQDYNPELKIMVIAEGTSRAVLRVADLLGAQAVVNVGADRDVLLRRVHDILGAHFVAF